MKVIEKANSTFCEVRDAISPVEHPIASRSLWTVPMAFYWAHSAEEAVALILEHEKELEAGMYDSDILQRATSAALMKLSRELRGE